MTLLRDPGELIAVYADRVPSEHIAAQIHIRAGTLASVEVVRDLKNDLLISLLKRMQTPRVLRAFPDQIEHYEDWGDSRQRQYPMNHLNNGTPQGLHFMSIDL